MTKITPEEKKLMQQQGPKGTTRKGGKYLQENKYLVSPNCRIRLWKRRGS